MVFWAGMIFDLRKSDHKDGGAKRFHHSFRWRINRHSSFILSRLLWVERR